MQSLQGVSCSKGAAREACFQHFAFKIVWLEPFPGPSFTSIILMFVYSSSVCLFFFLLELDLVLCVTTQAGRKGTEAVVPDFSDLDNTGEEVLLATQESSFGLLNV